ncbi:MAG: SAM-dependent methyltransferase [Candidatus Azosocius agrarius]|nr:MAG: SAM-dependent methyltransferase [Gammaproteobacteria bacterium]
MQTKKNLNKQIQNIIYMKNYINFYTYMKICLYNKKYGYYYNSIKNIGKEGDFITAPEIGFLFSTCLSIEIHKILKKLNGGYVIEIGAGTGTLAYKILSQFTTLNTPCQGYKIIEISKKLKIIQKNFLKKKFIQYKVKWINTLKKYTNLKGVIICNEVLDALPNYAFKINNNKLSEKIITLNLFNKLQWSNIIASNTLTKYIKYINLKSNKYESEINLLLYPWIKNISSILNKGYIFFFDYGYIRKEYYNNLRHQGMIICHYKHYATKNIFLNQGFQDITTHVDFTSIYEAIKINNMNYINFTNLSKFLLKFNLKKIIKINNKNTKKIYKEINKLISPLEMGEVFKMIFCEKKI